MKENINKLIRKKPNAEWYGIIISPSSMFTLTKKKKLCIREKREKEKRKGTKISI